MVLLKTIPVGLKKNNRKVKVNAILDDASIETFLNEEVAGMLGIQEPFQTMKVHVVLNNEIETFQSMPVNVTIESVDRQFRKSIDVKTCPRKVTAWIVKEMDRKLVVICDVFNVLTIEIIKE